MLEDTRSGSLNGLLVGYALLAELVTHRPPNPGREWWLLLDLALDADDTTRRTMPGYDFMADRTGAPRSTIYRWLASLHEQGMLRTVEHSTGGTQGTKGKRAVYEIKVPPLMAARVAQHLSGLTGGDLSLSTDRSQSPGPDPVDGSHSAGPVCGQPVRRSSDRSQSVGPPITARSVHADVEGAQEGSGQDHGIDDKGISTGLEREARRAPAA